MGYTPEWWERERDRVNAERAAKYRDDPEYRKAAKERARLYRARKREEREAAKKNPTITIGGVEVPALTTMQVCQYAGITASRIKYMQRAGYLPSAVVTRPVRLYSQKQADMIRDLEGFLRSHQESLRGPVTPESEKVLAELEHRTSIITKQWET